MRLFLLLFCFCSYCFADPFYLPEPENTSTAEFAKNNEILPRCKPNSDVENIYLPLDLTQLKLVGIIHINEQYKALFTDKENKLIDLKENDFIVSSHIQIEKVDFKKITIIDWKNTQLCHQPTKIQLKL